MTVRKIIDDLLEFEDVFSNWELQFVLSCERKQDELNEKQINKLEELYNLYIL